MTKYLFIIFMILGVSYTIAVQLNPFVSAETLTVDHVVNVTNNITTKATSSDKIQVALLLDTSNSMDGLIDQAKSQLWKMVNELANAEIGDKKPSIEIALYEFGNDGLKAEKGHIRMIEPLTNDLDQISEQLFRLKTNGGDEYCGWVIQDAVEDLKWEDNDGLKLIIIAGNEGYNQGHKAYKEACKKAKEKGIIINTIFCGNYQNGIDKYWADGATCANGKYVNIDQDDKVTHIPTPYDDEIIELNKKLNDTYIGYGKLGSSKKENQIQQDLNAASYGTANVRSRASCKSKSAYSNASWDIIDAIKDKKVKLTEIPKTELPAEMQSMDDSEKEAFIDNKRVERKALNDKIKALNKKSEAFIQEEQSKVADTQTLDAVLIRTIVDQAKQKGYSFK